MRQHDNPNLNICDEESTPLVADNSRKCVSLQHEIDTHFTPKKKQTLVLAGAYNALDMSSRALRVSDCGSFLEFHVSEDSAKLHAANFCKDRLCPMCAWRRSLKVFGQVSQVMDYLAPNQYRYLFLTLTVKNCSADELKHTVDLLLDGWKKLYHKNKTFRKLVKGSFRCLEVTRNTKTRLYHPHLHAILAVNNSYFKKGYLKQETWTEMWQNACGLDYVPVVNIKAVKDDGKGIAGAVAEVAKYSVKGSDYLRGSDSDIAQNVLDLLVGLSGRRLSSFTGVLDKARKELRLDDAVNGDLIHLDAESLRPSVADMIIRYNWKCGIYVKEVFCSTEN